LKIYYWRLKIVWNEETGTIERLRALSVSGVLRKPFDPGELLSGIERLAKQR